MNVRFREYTSEDKEVLFTLIHKLEEYAKSVDPIHRVKNSPGLTKIQLEEMLGNVSKYHGKIWLVKDGGKVVGYISGVIWKQSKKNKLEIGSHTLGEVIDIYLEPAYRGKGLGTQMLDMIEKYFKESGCDSMWIEVFGPNTHAHDLYIKQGFVEREIGMLKEI